MPQISQLELLKGQLLRTGLQQKDNILFQVLDTLIDSTRQLSSQIPSISESNWINSSFNAGDFTANGAMTWGVIAGNVVAMVYLIENKTMTVAVNLQTTTVGGVANTQLLIKIPGGYIPDVSVDFLSRVIDAGAAPQLGMVSITAGTPAFTCYKDLTAAANWTLGVNATAIEFITRFKIK